MHEHFKRSEGGPADGAVGVEELAVGGVGEVVAETAGAEDLGGEDEEGEEFELAWRRSWKAG